MWSEEETEEELKKMVKKLKLSNNSVLNKLYIVKIVALKQALGKELDTTEKLFMM
jgi:hypothetical protein